MKLYAFSIAFALIAAPHAYAMEAQDNKEECNNGVFRHRENNCTYYRQDGSTVCWGCTVAGTYTHKRRDTQAREVSATPEASQTLHEHLKARFIQPTDKKTHKHSPSV